jgi:hypothetical protein
MRRLSSRRKQSYFSADDAPLCDVSLGRQLAVTDSTSFIMDVVVADVFARGLPMRAEGCSDSDVMISAGVALFLTWILIVPLLLLAYSVRRVFKIAFMGVLPEYELELEPLDWERSRTGCGRGYLVPFFLSIVVFMTAEVFLSSGGVIYTVEEPALCLSGSALQDMIVWWWYVASASSGTPCVYVCLCREERERELTHLLQA